MAERKNAKVDAVDYQSDSSEEDMFEDNELDMKQFERDEEIEQSDGDDDDDEDNPKIEAFNLREEAKEGTFLNDGNYISNDKESDDEWFGDYGKSDIKRAREAQLARQKAQKSTAPVPRHTLLSELIDALEPSDTPMETLASLGKTKDRSRKDAVVKITSLCDQLGVDVYEMSREELMREYRKETGTDHRGTKRKRDEEEEEDYGEKVWFFRWKDDATVHGPYSSYEMGHWKENYFDDSVDVRHTDDVDFFPISDVIFD